MNIVIYIKTFNEMLSSGLRNVSRKQNTDRLYSEINRDTSLKLGFKPRQFH